MGAFARIMQNSRIKCGGWLVGVNFDLNDLQAFRAVVELGSFRKAAEAVNISQPALSRRIEKLEAALGVRLFERTTRSVTLTTVGRVFAPSAEQLLDDLDVALLGIRDVSTSRLGHVTIAEPSWSWAASARQRRRSTSRSRR